MSEPNLDLGLDYTGGIAKPVATQVGNVARVILDAVGGPQLDYTTRFQPPGAGNGSSNGNLDKTLVNGSATAWRTQTWNTPLTGDRSCILQTAGAWDGLKYLIRRTANATGAFNLIVNGIVFTKNLAAGQWCEVEFNGLVWQLNCSGTI